MARKKTTKKKSDSFVDDEKFIESTEDMFKDALDGDDEGIFDLAEKELKSLLGDKDQTTKLRAIALAPRFESMRPQKKNIILSEEMRFLVELLLHIEERFTCSAIDALKTLRRCVGDLEPILGKHSPRKK